MAALSLDVPALATRAAFPQCDTQVGFLRGHVDAPPDMQCMPLVDTALQVGS